MKLAKQMRTMLMTSAVLLFMTQGAGALDVGYQSTRSMRGVAIPRVNLSNYHMPIDFTGSMAAKVRYSDGQNWIAIQLGQFGYAAGRQRPELRILSKRVGGTTQILTIGYANPKSTVRVRRVAQTSTGVTFTLYWKPDGQVYQEITRRIAIPWAGVEHMLAAVSLPTQDSLGEQTDDMILFWEPAYSLDATAEWLTRVGWRRLPYPADFGWEDDYFTGGCNSTGTLCYVRSEE